MRSSAGRVSLAGFLRALAVLLSLASPCVSACGNSPAAATHPDSGSSGGSSSGSTGSSSGDDAGLGTPWDGGAFTHPGVLNTTAQLDFVKSQIAAGKQPWTLALQSAEADMLTQATYTPATPTATILCGSHSGGPDAANCKAEQSDSAAAYANAILWYVTGKEAYAQKAIQIMDSWSATFTSHGTPLDPAASNQFVQSGWAGCDWAPAAELIKYTHTMSGGWPNAGRFATMLKTAYLPYVVTDAVEKPFVGSTMADPLVPNGNWESVMICAGMGISVFLDDGESFNKVLAMWRARVPAYMYLLSDGPYPRSPPLAADAGLMPYTQAQLSVYWGGPASTQPFPLPSPDGNGFGQETCRDTTDMHHQEWGYSGLVSAAETAHIQGVDLYGEEKDRIVAAFEFAAKYLNGAAVPSWLCPGPGLHISAKGYNYEVGYNHYANRLGIPMPNTEKLLGTIRPTGADHSIVFETLTHADVH